MNLNEIFRNGAKLLGWSGAYSTTINAAPDDYGLGIQQCELYEADQAAFAAAYAKCQDLGSKTRTDTVVKSAARDKLVAASRALVDICQAWPGMTDAKRSALNIPIRDREPTPTPVPALAPLLEVVRQDPFSVTIRLRDAANRERRGKPPKVLGACLMTCVGDVPPNTVEDWTFQGNTTKTTETVEFPRTLVPGTKVWVTAAWCNARLLTGPPAAPVGVRLSGTEGLGKAA